MTTSLSQVGRPTVRGVNGSKTMLHCRVPEEMKAHWLRFLKTEPDYENLTDLVIQTLNRETGYQE